MKKRYAPPEWDMLMIKIQDCVLLTGSVEEGGDIIDGEYDDIEEP